MAFLFFLPRSCRESLRQHRVGRGCLLVSLALHARSRSTRSYSTEVRKTHLPSSSFQEKLRSLSPSLCEPLHCMQGARAEAGFSRVLELLGAGSTPPFLDYSRDGSCSEGLERE